MITSQFEKFVVGEALRLPLGFHLSFAGGGTPPLQNVIRRNVYMKATGKTLCFATRVNSFGVGFADLI